MKQKLTTPMAQVIVLVIAVIIIGALWYFNRPAPVANQTTNSTTPNTNIAGKATATTPPTPDAPPAKGENYLSIADQSVGKNVTVDALSFATPGFVAIHENDNGKPGKIIGNSALIAAGNKVDLIVKVSVMSGKTYFAMLHLDDGNKKFDATKDLPAKTAAGLIVMRQFSVK